MVCILSLFTLAIWLFGVAHASVLVPRVDVNMAPVTEEWQMVPAVPNSPDQPVWVATKRATGRVTFTSLFQEANRAFNWLRKQPNCATGTGTLLVAVFYDHRAQTLYASTVLRGAYLVHIESPANAAVAPRWRATRGPRYTDAESAVLYYRETLNPAVQSPAYNANYGGTDGKPDGSMVAIWGIQGGNAQAIRTSSGQPWYPCAASCRPMLARAGVAWDFVQGKKRPPPPPPPGPPGAGSAGVGPSGTGASRTGTGKGGPAPPRSGSPRPQGNRTPSPGASTRPQRNRTPSGGSSNSDWMDNLSPGTLEDLYNQADRAQRPGKRPASGSPEGSGLHRPQDPTTPSRVPPSNQQHPDASRWLPGTPGSAGLPHRPAPGARGRSQSPSGRGPARRPPSRGPR